MNAATRQPLRLTWGRFTLIALIPLAIFGGLTYVKGSETLRIPMGFACLSIVGYLAYRYHVLRTQVLTGALSDEELRRDFRGHFLGPLLQRVIWVVVTTAVLVGLIALQGKAPGKHDV